MAMGAEERRLERHPDHLETARGALPRGVGRQHRDRPGCGVRKAQGRAGDQAGCDSPRVANTEGGA